MVKRHCSLCNEKVDIAEVRTTSKSKTTNGIMIAPLIAHGCIDSLNARTIYAKCCTPNKFVCQQHFVQAAQFLYAEMAMVGKHCTKLQGETAGACVTLEDIPPNVVKLINDTMRRIDNQVVISYKDVWTFLNDVMRRYYGSSLWPEQTLAELLEVHPSGERIQKLEDADKNHMEDGRAAESGKVDRAESKNGGPSTSSSETFVSSEPSGSSSCLPECARSLAHTDSAELGKYYLIQGDKLMKLFRFCPECGYKLEKRQLTSDGTAAVVKFTCGGCRSNAPQEKRWESQSRTFLHAREEAFKGDLAVSVAAPAGYLPFIELLLGRDYEPKGADRNEKCWHRICSEA